MSNRTQEIPQYKISFRQFVLSTMITILDVACFVYLSHSTSAVVNVFFMVFFFLAALHLYIAVFWLDDWLEERKYKEDDIYE